MAHIPAMDERQASHGLIQWHGTTIIGVKKGGKTVIAGDLDHPVPQRAQGLARIRPGGSPREMTLE